MYKNVIKVKKPRVKINVSANARLVIHIIEGQNQDAIWRHTYFIILPCLPLSSHARMHLDILISSHKTCHTRSVLSTTSLLLSLIIILLKAK